MEDCVFCKIASGEIPSDFLWEDENFFAILDINPYAKGHVMVIPKKHSRWVWNIKDKEYSDYMIAVKKMAGFLREAFGTDCVQEIIAGLGVPHSHIHLLPRFDGDGLGEIPHKPLYPKLTKDEIKEIGDKIKSVIN